MSEPGGRAIVAAGTARVELVTPQAVSVEFGGAAPEPSGRREYLAALEFTVGSLAGTARALTGIAGIVTESGRVVVPARAAFNTALAFSEGA